MEIVKPMLAHMYERKLKHVTFPGYVQPKLDGIRACWNGYGLYTRAGHSIVSMPLLVKELREYFYGTNIDGELYYKGGKFEDIASSTSRTVNIEENKKIQYWMFDMIYDDEPFSNRISSLAKRFVTFRQCKNFTTKRLIITPTYTVNNVQQLEDYFAQFTREGFEGAMYRNAYGYYQKSVRSVYLLKMKAWKTIIAKIIGFAPGKGKHTGKLGAFMCVIGSNRIRVGTGMNDNIRQQVWDKHKRYMHTSIKIKYQELTKYGIPRFPVFEGFV